MDILWQNGIFTHPVRIRQKKIAVSAAVILVLGIAAGKILGGGKDMVPVVDTVNPVRKTIQNRLSVTGPVSGTDSVDVVSNLHAEILEINEKKLWTTGTDAEKKLITDKVQTALAWQQQTGIPTWVGAWMPGNYNKGNTYSVEEQTVFAGFMTKALSDAGIPFAVNADTKYYNAAENTWISSMQPVFKTIFQ